MPDLARRMSLQDAAFLYFEKPGSPLHITNVGVFEAPVPLARTIATMQERLHLIPRYRQRAMFPPLFAGHPVWVDDPEFSLTRHVREALLPPPAGDRELAIAAARIAAETLPRDRPLWDLTVFNNYRGSDGAGSAAVTRVHHCMIDGVSGVELALATMDLTPEPTPIPPPSEPWAPKPLPSPYELWSDAMFDQGIENIRAIALAQERLLDPRQSFRFGLDLLRSSATAARTGVRVPRPLLWNRRVGGERDLSWCLMQFKEIRGIRSALGGTVNDIVLTILGGALGRYLSDHGARVDKGTTIRVMSPVNVRKESEQQALGNRVSMMLTDVPAGIADGGDRLAEVRKATERAKSQNQASAFDTLLGLGTSAPAMFGALAGNANLPPGMINLVCTNVPGPQIPLYSCGVKQLAAYGMLPLLGDLGIGVAVGSYDQTFGFSITCDPNIVPDVDHMRNLFVEEFQKLRALASVPASDLPEIVRTPQPRTAQGRFAPKVTSVPVGAGVT
jgi:WS/DGAT/MGAT family acyltransferase